MVGVDGMPDREMGETDVNQINVIPVGAMVRIGRVDGITELKEAQVVAVMIEGVFNNDVSYKCVWWNDGTRCCEWIEGCEVHVSEETRHQEIGFKE